MTADNKIEIWRSRLTFILAATGAAVGLGNIWKFPYMTGENGGGAFVLVYLFCIVLIGIPVMIAEVMIGRRGRKDPINSVEQLATEAGANRNWRFLGALGMVSGLLILSYYSVIAGWALSYIGQMADGAFQGVSAESAVSAFAALQADNGTMLLWHSLFMLITMGVVMFGINRGLGNAINVMMPTLVVLLVVLLLFSMQAGDFKASLAYLFSPGFDKLSAEGVVRALGHAFFTLSITVGALIAYGAYMPHEAALGRMVITVGILDTLIALVAGSAIFAIIFANPLLSPASGPGLLFESLPIAFGNMDGGLLFGTLFFVLVSIAALSSSISLLEPSISWLVHSTPLRRVQASVAVGLLCWLVGLGSMLSFSGWGPVMNLIGERSFFDILEFATDNVLLPLGGMLIAIFVGWFMQREHVREELHSEREGVFSAWYQVLRYVSPVGILIVFLWAVIK